MSTFVFLYVIRYDLEEKILEKSIRTEVMMTQYMEKLEAALEKMAAYMDTLENTKKALEESNAEIQAEAKASLKNMTSYMKRTFDEYKVAIQSETRETLSNMTNAMDTLKSAKTVIEETNNEIRKETMERLAAMEHNITEMRSLAVVPSVSFNVRKAKNLTPVQYQVMTFEHVIQNMGGAYDVDTGVFTALYDGTYLFGVQVCAKQQKYGDFNLVVDNRENEILVVGDYDKENAYTSSSGTAIHHLNKGQRVWVMNNYKTELFESENWCWNQFTGVLINL